MRTSMLSREVVDISFDDDQGYMRVCKIYYDRTRSKYSIEIEWVFSKLNDVDDHKKWSDMERVFNIRSIDLIELNKCLNYLVRYLKRPISEWEANEFLKINDFQDTLRSERLLGMEDTEEGFRVNIPRGLEFTSAGNLADIEIKYV